MSNKALIVGVNKYKLPGSDLQGCVNDATNVRDILLKYFNFTVKDIRVLVDGRATKKAILDRLKWLVKDAKSGDRLLFHFSGHGSQIRDRDGDELKDSLDEIICPHDMDWDGTYIVDDDLKAVFAKLPAGVRLEVLLDSCHSGTATRQALDPASHLTPINPGAVRQRFLAPPMDILCRQLDEDDLPMTRMLKSANPANHALFSGCRDNQTSADAYIGGTYNGAFSYYFCKHLRDTQGVIPRAELLKRLRASLKHENYDQVPQLECPAAWKKKKMLE
jgi:metacaspase-1